MNGRMIKLRKDSKNRYLIVSLYQDKRPRTLLVHRLVWVAFNGEADGNEVNHINGVTDDNRLLNLELVTHSENERHKYIVLGYQGTGKGKSGSLSGRSSSVEQYDITTGKTIAIYGSMREAERATGTKNSCISMCCHGKQAKANGYGWRKIK